jgi:hypothetical protein
MITFLVGKVEWISNVAQDNTDPDRERERDTHTHTHTHTHTNVSIYNILKYFCVNKKAVSKLKFTAKQQVKKWDQ